MNIGGYDIPQPLKGLRRAFVERGFDLRFVGGCVRAYLMGEDAKDVDLCTDASPEESLDIYQTWGHDHYLTGIDHGTISVRAGEGLYEITSLREEFDHDGRHAQVRYTRDWIGDLSRRDLTFNAMALTFDGDLIDPFNGHDDLVKGVVRFVGDPAARVQEDYLRILRFFRFYARYGKGAPDAASLRACRDYAQGLHDISGERIWQEMRPILAHEEATKTVSLMMDAGVLPAIEVGWRNPSVVSRDVWLTRFADVAQNTSDPVLRALALAGPAGLPAMVERWRWSNAERRKAEFVVAKDDVAPTLRQVEFGAWVTGESDEHLKAWCDYFGADRVWRAYANEYNRRPTFPLTGDDFKAAGFVGPDIGRAMKAAKFAWAADHYQTSREDMLAAIQGGP